MNDVRYLPQGSKFLPTFALRDQDLLFTRYNGSLDLLGVCGMVRGLGGRTLLYPDKLMRVRFDHEFILPEYVDIFFQWEQVHDRVIAHPKSSAGQNGVSGSDIKAQPFALPALSEQAEIVRRVRALFLVSQQIRQKLANVETRIAHLPETLLAKAFRGELVPTEAELAKREGREYEPASVLLERIRLDRLTGEEGVEAPVKRKARRKSARFPRPTRARGA